MYKNKIKYLFGLILWMKFYGEIPIHASYKFHTLFAQTFLWKVMSKKRF